MSNTFRRLLLFAFMLAAVNTQAQSDKKQVAGTVGSISGRITLGGNPASNIKVLAFKGELLSQQGIFASTKTDQAGYFQLTGLPSDHYRILPVAPAYITSEQARPERAGKRVSLTEGETVEGIDFALVRGSVITGRITDEDGQPITGETVTLTLLGADGQKSTLYPFTLLENYDFSTDDQGIYRIFGLHPGRYLVSVGEDTEEGGRLIGRSRYHKRTFHPNVTNESKADIVELTAGAEATGIDITLGRTVKAYSISGRVIDASTGKPIPETPIRYGILREYAGGGYNSSSSTGPKADARGNFRIEGLLPGSFYVMAQLNAESGQYSKVVYFQVKDQDINGLEIKVNRGASISGVLAVDGVHDPEIIEKFSQLKLWASVSSPEINRGTSNVGTLSDVNANGSFYIAGLHPGKIFLHLSSNPDSNGFFLSRVERGGIKYADGIETGPGEQITDVRVVVGYASGRIRGQVNVEDGKLPAGAKISIHVWQVDGPSTQSIPQVQVDPGGRFVVENLNAGEYEVSAYVYNFSPHPVNLLTETPRKKVLVTNGAESEVILVIKLSMKDKDR